MVKFTQYHWPRRIGPAKCSTDFTNSTALCSAPPRYLAQVGAQLFSAPGSWLAHLPGAARVAAGYELIYRLGKNYEKPQFGIQSVDMNGATVAVVEQTVLAKPFCRLQRFQRCSDQPDVIAKLKRDPAVLLVAPLSGHHATLLRDTVTRLLPSHDVYVTDWVDARMVPVHEGAFTLDDYVGYISRFHPTPGRQAPARDLGVPGDRTGAGGGGIGGGRGRAAVPAAW